MSKGRDGIGNHPRFKKALKAFSPELLSWFLAQPRPEQEKLLGDAIAERLAPKGEKRKPGVKRGSGQDWMPLLERMAEIRLDEPKRTERSIRVQVVAETAANHGQQRHFDSLSKPWKLYGEEALRRVQERRTPAAKLAQDVATGAKEEADPKVKPPAPQPTKAPNRRASVDVADMYSNAASLTFYRPSALEGILDLERQRAELYKAGLSSVLAHVPNSASLAAANFGQSAIPAALAAAEAEEARRREIQKALSDASAAALQSLVDLVRRK